jgi:hypothetical protein
MRPIPGAGRDPSAWGSRHSEFPLEGRPQRTGRNITAILLEAGVVTEEQVERGVLRQRETGLRIGETLVELGAVTEEDVGWALSRQLGLTLVDLDPRMLDAALVRSFKETLLRRSDAVPLLRAGATTSFAVADPTDDEVLDRLEDACGGAIELSIGTPTAIRRALDTVFEASVATAAPAVPIVADARYDVVWERSGATFLAFHAASALRAGARAIHFLPRDGQLHVSYRQAGKLVPVASEPAAVLDALLARLEALGGPVLGDAFHARGTVRCALPTGESALDVSLLRGANGIDVCLIPRPRRDSAPALEELGIDPVDAAALRGALAARSGVAFVCGPPGAGGSTLLSALGQAAGLADARVLVFEPGPTASWPGATRLSGAAAEWRAIAVAQGADAIVLDGTVGDDALDAVLSPEAAQRLVLVRAFACDSLALLEGLARTPAGAATLARRLIAAIQVRALPLGTPLCETLLPDEGLRRAIEDSAPRARLAEAAVRGGFRTLAERARERVAAGTLNELDAVRVLS